MFTKMDFILPSCPGIPDSMWLAASALIDGMIKRCWLLLSAFFAIQLIVDAFRDASQGQFSLGVHIRTCFHVIMIGCFLHYYKPILMFFDRFIDSLCINDKAVVQATLERSKQALINPITNRSWLASFKILLKAMIEIFPKMISLFTHAGAIHAMHYLKAVTLLVISQLGPLAALFSLLPGPFKKGWITWASSYIQVTCWTITLHILGVLVKASTTASLLTDARESASFFSETIGHTFLSFILFIAIFLTPSWTAKFMGHTTTSNLGNALSFVLGRIGIPSRGRSNDQNVK